MKISNKTLIVATVITACLIMALVDAVISPPYAVKSLIKILLFLGLPLFISYRDKSLNTVALFQFNKKSICNALLLGMGLYIFIIAAYFIIGPYFDMSMVTKSLESSIGVNKHNFLFVAAYISLINSLLEEFFFRGFAFITLKRTSHRRFSYVFSSLAFALYHVAIMTNWFGIPLYLLLIIGLFIGGIIFNWLNEKYNNIYSSWLVHMFANFAINTVGCILFGMT